MHAAPSTEHAWVLTDMMAATGLHSVINVHAVPSTKHARAFADMKVAAALQFINAELLFPKLY